MQESTTEDCYGSPDHYSAGTREKVTHLGIPPGYPKLEHFQNRGQANQKHRQREPPSRVQIAKAMEKGRRGIRKHMLQLPWCASMRAILPRQERKDYEGQS